MSGLREKVWPITEVEDRMVDAALRNVANRAEALLRGTWLDGPWLDRPWLSRKSISAARDAAPLEPADAPTAPASAKLEAVDTREAAPSEDEAKLQRIVEAEVIPRLMLAHRLDSAAPDAPIVGAIDAAAATPPYGAPNGASTGLDMDAVETLARLALEREVDVLLRYLDGVRAAGASSEAVFVELLAPAARRLGNYWDEDEADFLAVTIALNRLHRTVRALSEADAERDDDEPSEMVDAEPRRRAVVASFPGEQHVFGALILAAVFRRNGWTVIEVTPDTIADLGGALKGAARFGGAADVVCLSISCDHSLETLQGGVAAVRAAAPTARLLVGGPSIIENPTLATLLGAEGTARDAIEAVAVARRLVDAEAPTC